MRIELTPLSSPVGADLRHASITTTGYIYVEEIPASFRSAVNATTREIPGNAQTVNAQKNQSPNTTVSKLSIRGGLSL
jgi:hypothetical protein